MNVDIDIVVMLGVLFVACATAMYMAGMHAGLRQDERGPFVVACVAVSAVAICVPAALLAMACAVA